MYVRKGRKVRQTGVGLWDPRRAGLTMPEPIINHGYNTGVSALGLWDPRSAGETMPEPKINRAYIAGVVYDDEPGDYPQLKNPPGITPAGLGGVEVTVSRSVEGVGDCGRCHRCQQGLGCWHAGRGLSGLGFISSAIQAAQVQTSVPERYGPLKGPGTRGMKASPKVDPTTFQVADISYTRPAGSPKWLVEAYKGTWKYVVDPSVLSAAVRQAIQPDLDKLNSGVTLAKLAEDKARLAAAATEKARMDKIDVQRRAELEAKYSAGNLLKESAKERVTEGTKFAVETAGAATKGVFAGIFGMVPKWMWAVAGVGVAGYVYFMYFRKPSGDVQPELMPMPEPMPEPMYAPPMLVMAPPPVVG